MDACRTCGTPITQALRGRPRLYCSPRCRKAPQSRATEYANRNAKRRRPDAEPLPELFPDLDRGAVVSWWQDELRKDLRQEAALAEAEGRDPVEAVRSYRAREYAWRRITVPLIEEAA